jgi:hypothetical protein
MAQMTKADTAPDIDSTLPPTPETTEPASAAPQPDDRPAPPRQDKGAMGLVLGGVIAAALGAGAAIYTVRLYPDLAGAQDLGAVTEHLTRQDKQIADLSAALAALPAPIGPDQATADALASLQDMTARQAKAEDNLAALTDRIAQLEKLPVGAGTATALEVATATEAATKAARAAEEEARRLKSEAEAATRKATAVAAFGQMAAALESGAPLQPALDAAASAGLTLPQGLSDVAQGAPTLQSLHDTFPPAARDALALSLRATADGGLWNRFSAFLRSQTGARSLTPVAGNDPDAILSRAEAAVGTGDLKAALTEIATLPTEGQARMAEWVALATRRQTALEALATLQVEVGQ